METEKIYIVDSFTNTVPGRIIKARAALKFWNRWDGDTYSHTSLSRDIKLGNMISLARREIDNPLNCGFIKENIRKDVFALNKEKSQIAVMELSVTKEQYIKISNLMDYYWEHRDEYHFNFAGLVTMLLYGKGLEVPNHFFCSQWVATVLKDSGIDLFDGKNPKDIRPFDFYGTLRDHIIYEGLTTEYPEYHSSLPKSVSTYSQISHIEGPKYKTLSSDSAPVLRKSIRTDARAWR